MPKVEVEIPEGLYCTGCPFAHWVGYTYGCIRFHVTCASEGDYQNRQLKCQRCYGNESPKQER